MSKTPDLRVLNGGASQDPDGDTLTRLWRDAVQRPSAEDSSEPLIVHFAGHGIPGAGTHQLFLASSKTSRDNVSWSAPQVSTWLGEVESLPAGPSVLLLLDVCGAGRPVVQQLLDGIRAEDRRAWIIAACAPDEKTYRARFTKATAAVLERLRKGRLDLSPAVEYVPVETLAREIDRELARSAAAEGVAAQSVLRTAHAEARTPVPPFLLNPSYRETPGGQFRQAMANGLWQFAAAVDPGLDPLHFISRASGAPEQQGSLPTCFFTGREDQLKALKHWLEDDGAPSLLVVTGSPGSGKSALLGVVACLAHPQLREVTGQIAAVVDRDGRPELLPDLAAVHARQRGPSEVLSSLATQLGLGEEPSRGWTTSAVLNRITEQRENPVTLVVDALDEASLDKTLLNEVLIPLANARRRPDEKEPGKNLVLCRVLIGTRPWLDRYGRLFDALADPRQLINLDDISAEQRISELDNYLCDVLAASRLYSGVGVAALRKATAVAVAERLGKHHDRGAFLLASLFAHYLVHQEAVLPLELVMARIPAHLPGMLDLHLEVLRREHPAMPAILAAIAHGYGQGMPLEVIESVTAAFLPAGVARPDVDDIRMALQAASFYLRFDTEVDGQRLYRFYHQSLVDHLRRGNVHIGRRALCDRVLDTVPGSGEPVSRRFGLALPYVLRHAAQHARDARMLDGLLSSASFLIHCDPLLLHEHLTTGTLRAQIAATISALSLSPLHEPWQRRQWLRNTAEVWGETWLIDALDAIEESTAEPPLHCALEFRWGTNDRQDGYGPRHADEASLIRYADRWLAVLGEFQEGVHVWDVRMGVHLYTLRVSEGHTLTSLCTRQSSEGALAAAGTDEGRICVWDLETGTLKSEIGTDTSSVVAVALVQWLESELVVACGGGEVVAYDLLGRRVASLDLIGGWLTSLEADGRVDDLWEPDQDVEGYDCTAVATTVLDGTPVFVAGAVDGSLHVWEVGGRHHRTWPGGTGRIYSLDLLDGPGGPFVLTFGEDGTRWWDLRTGQHRLLAELRHQRALALFDGHGRPCVAHFRQNSGLILRDFEYGAVLADPFRSLPEGISGIDALAVAGSYMAAVASVSYGAEFLSWTDDGMGSAAHIPIVHDTEVEFVAVGGVGEGSGLVPAISVDAHGHFLVWDAATGLALASGREHDVRALVAGTLGGKSVVVLACGWGKKSTTEVIDLTSPEAAVVTLRWENTVDEMSIDVVDGSPALIVQTAVGIFAWQPESVPIRLDDTEEGAVIRCYARYSHRGEDVTIVGTSDHMQWEYMLHDSSVLTLYRSSLESRVLAERQVEITCTAVGHWDGVAAAAYGDGDGSVVAVSLESSSELGRFKAHEGRVATVAFVLPQGVPLLVTAGADDAVRVWDPRRTGTMLSEISFPATLGSVSVCDAGVFAGFGSRVAFFAWADFARSADSADETGSS
ncbi:AAA family ATPase [Streptomyces bauhiniae]|uniref:AAA family ATPase n=1 Tax=Streptomyces bauhiniae TaxID=2340725 RepID=UPI0035D6F4A5